MARKKTEKYRELFMQALLIVFSVLFALFLDEYRSNIKTKKELQQITHKVEQEILENRIINDDLIIYHLEVIKNIENISLSDSAINNLKSDFGLKLFIIAPNGIMQKSVSNSVWQTAKLNPTLNQIEFKKLQLIGNAYIQQEAIFEQVDIISEIIRSREMLDNDITVDNLILIYNEISELREKEIELSRIYEKVLTEFE